MRAAFRDQTGVFSDVSLEELVEDKASFAQHPETGASGSG
jgi:hypothetical protein